MAAGARVDGKVVIDLSVVGSECATATLNAFPRSLGRCWRMRQPWMSSWTALRRR